MAASAAPYVGTFAYTNSLTYNPYTNSNNQLVEVDVLVRQYYHQGSGAYYYRKDKTTYSLLESPFDVVTFVNITTHTWGWADGALDAGETTEIHMTESTVPDASSYDSTNYIPATVSPGTFLAFPPNWGTGGSLRSTNQWNDVTQETGDSTVVLETEGLTNSTASRLWRLKLTLTDLDPLWGYPGSVLPPGGIGLCGKLTDTNGCVSVILPDNAVTNLTLSSVPYSIYYYAVEATPVELTGIQWLNPATSSWAEDDLYVLTNTAVVFHAKANVDSVQWPDGLLTWTLDGSTCTPGMTEAGVSGTNYGLFSKFFDEYDQCSLDTDFHLVTVAMADQKFTNKTMVAGLTLRAIPVDTNVPNRVPFLFGVGEIINIVPEFTPDVSSAMALRWTNWSSFDWSTRDPEDRGKLVTSPPPIQYKAGSDPETNWIRAAIENGPSAGQPRELVLQIVAPTNVVLRALRVRTNVVDGTIYLVSNTNIAHQINSMSAVKRATFFLLPDNVSFTGIKFREGDGAYTFNGQASNVVAGTARRSNGTWFSTSRLFGPQTHAVKDEFEVIKHAGSYEGSPAYPNAVLVPDNFGVFWGKVRVLDDSSSNLCEFVPSSDVEINVAIALQYQFNVRTNGFGTVPSMRILAPNKNTYIRKDSLPQNPDNFFQMNFTNSTVNLFN